MITNIRLDNSFDEDPNETAIWRVLKFKSNGIENVYPIIVPKKLLGLQGEELEKALKPHINRIVNS